MNISPIDPGPGQESIWDYPRPPKVEPSRKHVQVYFAGKLIADTHAAIRVLETSHPPAYYLPPQDVASQFLRPVSQKTFCEYKGQASYFDVVADAEMAPTAAWYYPDPSPGYEAIKDHTMFYPQRMEGCFVNGERVRPQEGGFYGGWITEDVVGPFKGGPDSAGW